MLPRWEESFSSLTAVLLILTPFVRTSLAVTPAIEVGLRSAWNEAPFLVELLETAADEDKNSYFPLLDRIANREFQNATTEKDLYTSFLHAAQESGFLTDSETVSSFNLALSIRSAAPRIEAHYHYYANSLEPLMGKLYDKYCRTWLMWSQKQICRGDYIDGAINSWERFPNPRAHLQFDRVYETKPDLPAAIHYADIEAPEFKLMHEKLREYARQGKISYRVRYLAPQKREERPVVLSGYGVELALKKTDYMVMDDREVQNQPEGEDGKKEDKVVPGEEEEIADITPLHPKDVSFLGVKTASYIMSSEDPLKRLVKVTQDFLKYTPTIAGSELNEQFMEEYRENRDAFLGPGANAIWVNGLQLDDSQVNAFSLLDSLRRERKYIKALTHLHMNTTQATKLLTHPAILEGKEQERPQRFDYRDDIEGGKVIIWMNNLAKDKRYEDWPTSTQFLLRRLYPGQLPQIKKNIFNFVMPLDFTNKDDVQVATEQLQMFVMRKIALRFGIVPIIKSHESAKQAKVVYYLLDTYGLGGVLEYLGASVEKKEISKASKKVFESTVKEAKLRKGKQALTFEEVLDSPNLDTRVEKTRGWGKRLGVTSKVPPAFINGLAIPRAEDWVRQMSARLEPDVLTLQRAVFESATEDMPLEALLLGESPATRRNTHIFPEDEVTINQVNIADVMQQHQEIFSKLPIVSSEPHKNNYPAVFWVVGDFDEADGFDILKAVATVQQSTPGVILVAINNPELLSPNPSFSTLLHHLNEKNFFTNPERLLQLMDEIPPSRKHEEFPKIDILVQHAQPEVKSESWYINEHVESGKFWKASQRILESTGLKLGQRGLVLNGRVVGPIPKEDEFTEEDVKQLLEYEKEKRIDSVLQAADELEILAKLSDKYAPAILTNLVSLTTVPEVPPGMFESLPSLRIDTFDRWETEHSCITTGDKDSAIFSVVASIDPASERAQRWVPILKVLSEMSGVYLRIFMNPQRILQEIPVKRFYRYVLNSAPVFDEAGRIVPPRAHFVGMPEEALLTLGMDVPPSWLVTPKECIHDLDNIKLSSLKERVRGGDVTAIYELRSILIQGHARDVTAGGPPKGVQLVLGTEKEPHFADTIIMANLGYFQFKANPGYWKMDLKDGRSKDIFKIDSTGTKGFSSKSDDENPDLALMSFVGATLFPRLSRKPGKETADVLDTEAADQGTMAYVNKGLNFLDNTLTNLGLLTTPKTTKQAEINIFSVASGHLYERFLNIMMLSVMKHTTHTVKFWFIENFLSPSFKDFIPIMAKEYGFQYELVTYKWPHWLRAQKEKQREIWGYKILFLDVLFPLDLEKVIFVDADQIVRTDLKELVDLDLQGAPYGFTPMCDSRTEIEGFRFWKQGYWKNFLKGMPYHISALYVVDLKRFRQVAAGDRLRQQYHSLSADPNSLANLDQDLPNHMQSALPIFSLPQDWLWCETWCSDESLATAKTIDLCNNPMTKEPKLDRARRQVPEWTEYDEEVKRLAERQVVVPAQPVVSEEGQQGKDEL